MTRKLYRSKEDRAILGICGGIGEYLDIDPIIIRLIVVILTLLGFSGLLFYIVAIFVIPENPEYREAKGMGGQYQQAYDYTYTGSEGTSQSGETKTYDYEVGPDGEVKEVKVRKKSNGNGALALGLGLISAGVFILIEMFMPWIDTRLILAAALIIIGIVVIAKRK